MSARDTLGLDCGTNSVRPLIVNAANGKNRTGRRKTPRFLEQTQVPSTNRRGFIRAAALSTLALTSSPGRFFAAEDTRKAEGALSLDLTKPAVKFNRMLFGQFLEHFHRQVYGGVFEPGSPLADERGFRKDVIAALRELKVPVVRWPGGCFVSSYHWLHGVGRHRQPNFDKAWGVEDPNTFGTDEFVLWCRAIGAEPYICTNAGTGTAEEMSDWVEYCNLPSQGRYARLRRENGFAEPHDVKFWSVGNENYGAWEIGAKTVAEWGPLVRESAKMMRAVDKTIKLFAAATTRRDWTVPLLKEAGRHLDYISIHGYWAPQITDNRPIDYLKCMMWTAGPERAIVDAVKLLEETGFKDQIRIAYDEWNLRAWHHPGFPGGGTNADLIKARDRNDDNTLYTMADAVFSACFLNACLRHAQHVHMACMAPVVNTRGPLFVHPDGLVRRPTFHVMKMYAEQLEANVLPAEIASGPLQEKDRSVPTVDAVATISDDRQRLVLALVNKHPDKPVEVRLDLGLQPRGAQTTAIMLAADSPDAFNDTQRPDRVVPEVREWTLKGDSLLLPPHSISTVRISL